ncbi:MAG: hypothetical protein ABII23_09525 [bacterium]
MKKAGLFILLFFVHNLFAAFEDKKPGARPAGMGGAFTASADDANALYYNPGGLGFIRDLSAVFSHTDLFSLRDLRYDSAGSIIPITSKITAGIGYSQFGPDMYRETQLTAGCGVKILDNVSWGVSVQRLDLRIKDYGSAYDWAGSIGFLGKMSNVVSIGMNARNIFSTHLGNTDELPEKAMSFGLKIRPKPHYQTVIDIARELDGDQITYRIGQEVFVQGILIVRCGFHNYPDRVSGGFGIRWKGFGIDYALIMHPKLDLQHQFSFLIGF